MGIPQADDSVQYEFKSVQALRGRERSANAKWQDEGWELVSEDRGTLRTELRFRRMKPQTLGAHLLRFLPPKLALGAKILVAGIVGVVVVTQSDAPAPSAARTTGSAAPPAEQVLSADDSEELAALLAVPDYCDETIAAFVANHGGRTIEFDGSIANLANHGDSDTRYDVLVAPGDKGPESTVGPAFTFEDVNVSDLDLTGATIPESVGEGDRFRFVAQVVEYDPTGCQLFLAPVSTRVR